jgi:transposase
LLASLLQAFYGIRSERLLLEQLHYNLLFRWFVGLSPDDRSGIPPRLPKTASGFSMTTLWGVSSRN